MMGPKKMYETEIKIAKGIFADLDDTWCARISDYDEHQCDDKDGVDIGWSKATYERIKKKWAHL